MKILLFLFLVCYCAISMAQESLKTADEHFRKQDYEKALQHLQIILANPDQLKGDERSFTVGLATQRGRQAAGDGPKQRQARNGDHKLLREGRQQPGDQVHRRGRGGGGRCRGDRAASRRLG